MESSRGRRPPYPINRFLFVLLGLTSALLPHRGTGGKIYIGRLKRRHERKRFPYPNRRSLLCFEEVCGRFGAASPIGGKRRSGPSSEPPFPFAGASPSRQDLCPIFRFESEGRRLRLTVSSYPLSSEGLFGASPRRESGRAIAPVGIKCNTYIDKIAIF